VLFQKVVLQKLVKTQKNILFVLWAYDSGISLLVMVFIFKTCEFLRTKRSAQITDVLAYIQLRNLENCTKR